MRRKNDIIYDDYLLLSFAGLWNSNAIETYTLAPYFVSYAQVTAVYPFYSELFVCSTITTAQWIKRFTQSAFPGFWKSFFFLAIRGFCKQKTVWDPHGFFVFYWHMASMRPKNDDYMPRKIARPNVIYYDVLYLSLSLVRPVHLSSSAAQSFWFSIVIVVGPERSDRLQTEKYRSNALTVKKALLAHDGDGTHG